MDYEIVLKQLGGTNRLKAIIGAYNFVHSRNEKFVSFYFKGNSTMNFVKILYDQSRDLYRYEFLKVVGVNVKIIRIIKDIYADDLIPIFEDVTGLYLRL